MQSNLINYGRLIDEAMHVIVFKVLKRVEQEGLPGEHHFFISFITTHKGVRISNNLLAKYPQEMTIILQYQYQDLTVDSKGFSITLSFHGQKESIYIPYASITHFADPSVQFGLQFREVGYHFDEEDAVASLHHSSMGEALMHRDDNASANIENNVVSFEQLRKMRSGGQ